MSGGGGDYLDNDMLISNQLVFDIVDVMDDRNGGFNGNDRWMLKVEPHYDGEQDPAGLITLNDNPARRKFMAVIQAELDELEKKGEEVFIGPCVLVKLKGRNYRYIEVVEWDKEANQPILPNGAVLAGAGADQSDFRGGRRTRGGADAQQPSTPSTSAEPASGPVGTPARARSFAPADGGNAATRSASPAATPPPAPDPAPSAATAADRGASTRTESSSVGSTEFPTFKEWAVSQGIPVSRGRPKREVAEAYERAKAAATGTGAYAAPEPRQRTAREKPPEPHTRPAQVGAGAPAKSGRPPEGGASSAREVVWSPGVFGTATCPVCNDHVHDRAFPAADGSFSVVHKCQNGEPLTLDAVLDAPEGN